MRTSLPSQVPEIFFQREKAVITARLLLIPTLVIFGLETLLMFLFEDFLIFPPPFDWIMDGLILALILFPLNYFVVFLPMAHRIERHYQTRLELLNSNEVVQSIFAVNGILIAYIDHEFNYVRVNEAYAGAAGRDPADMAGRNHFALFPSSEDQKIFTTVLKTGEPYFAYEKPFEFAADPARSLNCWDWSLMPMKKPDGQVFGLIFVLTDVTERKQAQLALADSERRFRAVFNQTFQQMGLLDPAGSILLLNQTALDFSGFSHEAVAGKPFWELPWWLAPAEKSPSPAEQLRQAVRQAGQQEVVRAELEVQPVNGDPAIMDITFKPLLDDQGTTRLVIYEGRDITERIHSERALRESEREINRLYQRAETLRKSVQSLSGSLNSNTVLEVLLETIYQVVPFDSAYILLLEDEDHLVVRLERSQEDRPEDRRPEAGRLREHRCEIADCLYFEPILLQREVLSIPDWSASQAEAEAFLFPAPRTVRSWLGLPLQAGDQVIGVCLLGHTSPHFFSDELTQWAVTLTCQASVAMHNAWLFEQVRDNREQLQALSRRLVESQENERHYIARELHDEAGQALASLMLGLRHLESDSGDREAVVAHCQELKGIADSVLENLHRLAINLRPATLDHLGLVAALRQHAETMSLQHKLAVQFAVVGPMERLPADMETAIYRIVQESLTNIIRHAGATRVDILLERRNSHIVVVVEDNGIGFDPQEAKLNQLGVLGMRERAEMLGGTITIESSPGTGSTIILEIPCPSESLSSTTIVS